MAVDDSTRIRVGRISGVFGVRGWVKIRSDTSPVSNILEYQPWHLETPAGWVEQTIEQGRVHGKHVVVLLPGYTDRESARRLVGVEIAISREQLPEPAEDEYYWADLVGLEVKTADGTCLGTVSGLMETGSNDVLVVKGEKEHLVPLLWDTVVSEIDPRAGYIVVDWDPDY